MPTTGEATMRLKQWGVENIFGYPGEGINGLLEALESLEENGPLHSDRHEELAAFAVCAYGRSTGRPGLHVPSGPRAIHMVNGLYDAKLDRSPVVAIVGQQATSAQRTSFQHEVDLRTLFKA